MRQADWAAIRYFRPEEWRYDPEKVVPALVMLLSELRSRAGVPIVIHEAWADKGHSEKSYHYRGMAVDFHFEGNLSYLEQFAHIVALQFGGIGFYPGWHRPGWHVDLRAAQDSRLFWTRQRGEYKYGPNAIARVLRR